MADGEFKLEKDSEGRVKCKCGRVPEIDSVPNLEGPNNSMHYRLECPKCGHKNAPWRRSELMAVSEWEEKYWKL